MIKDDAPVVSEGDNGYLYLVGGAQNVIRYISGSLEIPNQAIARFEANLKNRQLIAQNLNAKFVHCVCPDKHSVIPEHFPHEIKVPIADLFQVKCSSKFLFPISQLRACKTTFGYLKTDSHWNHDGRIAVALAVLNEFGLTDVEVDIIKKRLEPIKKTYTNFCGDLGSKLSPNRDEVADILSDTNSPPGIFSYSNNVSGNNGMIKAYFNTDALLKDRMLVFGDSFILHCIPIFSLFFKEILFLRSPYFHLEIAQSFAPSHILSSTAERYLPNTTNDADAPIGLLMAGLAGKMWRCEVVDVQAINAILQPNTARNRNFWSLLRESMK